MKPPKMVILHCSDTPDYPETDVRFDRFGADDINLWHIERGWDKIGYHFIVRRTGVLETGRLCSAPHAFEVGAHCSGHNLESIGVCYIGRESPTKNQIEKLKSLYLMIKKVFGIDKTQWFAHHHFNSAKTCPGFPIENFTNLL